MSDGAVCYLVVAAITIGLSVWGFIQIFQKQLASESDSQVLQRQLRGFALLVVAQIALFLGQSLCTGMGFSLKGLTRAMKL